MANHVTRGRIRQKWAYRIANEPEWGISSNDVGHEKDRAANQQMFKEFQSIVDTQKDGNWILECRLYPTTEFYQQKMANNDGHFCGCGCGCGE